MSVVRTFLSSLRGDRRHAHELLDTRDATDEDNVVDVESPAVEASNNNGNGFSSSEGDEEIGLSGAASSSVVADENTTVDRSRRRRSDGNGDEIMVIEENDDDDDLDDDDVENMMMTMDGADMTAVRGEISQYRAERGSATVSLAELEEERELARRRTSACVLLAVMLLFRLWVEALKNADFMLLLLCLVGTSWTARWIRHNREREEELDRRITAYLESSDPSATEVDRNDLRMLSFQAQLALAIMDSQRQMMQGGFGHPEGAQGGANSGLSDEAKKKWDRFNFETAASWATAVVLEDGVDGEKASSSKRQDGYGSVSRQDSSSKHDYTYDEDDAPNCSICLSEYEEGEPLVRLPCGHIYHDECVSSWTSNHIRCPLCNLDLESVVTKSSSNDGGQQQDTNNTDDSIV